MSILSNNKPVAHLGRTSHDLSSTHAFSMRPAVLRPVVYQDCVPDSAFRINVADLVRTSSLQTAAFLRGKHELDFFFVPYSMLYSGFNNIVLERGDMPSPALLDFETDEVPSVSLPHLYYAACLPYVFQRYCSYWYGKDPDGRISDYVETFFRTWSGDSDFDETDVTSVLLSFLYNSVDATVFYRYSDLSFIGYDTLGFLDIAGYGNIGAPVVALLDSLFADYTSYNLKPVDVVDSLKVALTNYFVAMFPQQNVFNPLTPNQAGFPRVNLLRLFAYQKVFYDRYRDAVFDENPLYSYSFSMDYDLTKSVYDPIAGLTVEQLTSSRNVLLTFLRVRTRQVKKDLVSGLFPAAQFGSQVPITNDDVLKELNVPLAGDGQIGAANIRFALAAQKYRETLLRAGSRSKDVLKALFGVESKYIDDTYVRWLGSYSGQLDLNKVSATAESGTYSVGDLAGNVFSSLQGQTINFTCNDFGCIIGVMSFFPEVLHNNFGLSPHVLKSKSLDYFKAAFEDLGLQPVSTSIVSVFLADKGGGEPYFDEQTLGFSARYNEYKINLDFSHDQFGVAPRPFAIPSGNNDVGIVNVNPNDGFNSNYVVTRSVYQDVSDASTRNYLLPDCMDMLFTSLDTGDISNYHFDVILDVSINAILPMSNLGLPY